MEKTPISLLRGITFAAAGIAVGTLGVYAMPAVTAFGPLRRTFLPDLAGLSDSRSIALTFDDGPDVRSTPLFLEKLSELGWNATFFMLGDMAIRAPSLVAEVAAAGHEIAVHGYHHTNLLRMSPRATDGDIRRAQDLLSELSGVAPRFYRPPYGVLNLQALLTAHSVGLTPVLWSAWGRDWRAKATPSTVMADLSSGIRSGATLLLHDSDCTSTPDSFRSTLGALDLLGIELLQSDLSIERLCDHFRG